MTPSKKLFALFIGINGYQECNPLNGCINDVLEMQRYFKTFSKTNGLDPQFNFLLAPFDASDEKSLQEAEIDYGTPTRANIVAAIETLFAQADPKRGDCCLLYYTGHGSKLRAPAEFELYEPTGHFQTLVCLDSRQEGQRDLIDKELGYLVAKGLVGKTFNPEDKENPGVQFVAIMDCCHSGNNLRSAKRKIISRMTPGKNVPIQAEDILGFTRTGNEFYQPLVNNKVARNGLKHTRYVSLSASRDHESAYEMSFADGMGPRSEAPAENKQYGIFTYSLLRSLYRSAGQLSYADLAKRAELEIRGEGLPQRPLVWANPSTNDADLALFQCEVPASSTDHFQVICKKLPNQTLAWVINAGKLHGIVPSTPDFKTQFLLNDGRTVEVSHVFTTHSRLDGNAFSAEDQDKVFSATIAKLAISRIKVGYDASLPETARQELEAAFQKTFAKRLAYFELQGDAPDATIFIKQLFKVDRNGNTKIRWTALSAVGGAPMFIAVEHVQNLLDNLNKVGKWEYALQMNNPSDEQQYKKDIEVKVDVLEGVIIEGDADDQIWKTELNPTALNLRYVNDIKPKLRVQIGLKDGASRPYHIGAMYLSALYGIYPEMGKVKKIGIGVEDKQVRMSYDGDEVFSAELEDTLQEYGVSSITEYILVFVSSDPFDLDHFKQAPISLDGTLMGPGSGQEKSQSFWFTIKIPIHVQRPLPAVALKQDGTATSLTRKLEEEEHGAKHNALAILSPEGFQAKVKAFSAAQLRQRGESQIVKKGSDDSPVLQLPPVELWQGANADVNPFCHGLAGEEDSHLSILDFSDIEGTLSNESPLVITPGDHLQNPYQKKLEVDWNTPSLQQELVLPYGQYKDKDGTQFYIPLGFTNATGEILLTQLPNLDDPAFEPTAPDGGKSVGTALRAWFQKLIWSRLSGRHDYNTLALHPKGGEPILYRRDVPRYAQAKDSIQSVLKDAKKVLLLIHGIIGETEKMLPAFLEHPELSADFDAILTFDYENLDTSIEESAKNLHAMLSACGLPDGKKLTIVAHSMGGLVSRWWIEKEGGAAYVHKLIQAGTPNQGTDIELFRQKLISLLTLGINAVARFKPYLANLSFLTGGLGKSLFKTLAQMGPESEFLRDLNSSTDPQVPYYLLAGDTSDIEAIFKDEDPLWRKIWACLRDRSPYILADTIVFGTEPNDMAVSTESMQTLPWGTHTRVLKPQCDHLGYFENPEAIKMLKELIGL